MRTWKWMFTAALLVSLSAAAQQPAESRQPAPTSHTQISPTSGISVAALSVAQSAPAPQASQPATAPEPTPSAQTPPTPTPSALSRPATMDQVVDRFIEREHGLMKALSSRTPLVESLHEAVFAL